jgi:uncharacterized membrane protein
MGVLMATKKTKAASAGTSGSASGNIYAIIAYLLGILGALIVIVAQKKDKFALFHAKQSLVLSIVAFIVGMVLGFIPILGWLIAATIFPLAVVAAFLWGAYKAYQGEWYRFPMVADWADKINL